MAALLAGFAAGAVLALVHFRALAINVRLYLGAAPPWRGALLHVARGTLCVGVLWTAAGFGAPALLACLAGFSVARIPAMRPWR